MKKPFFVMAQGTLIIDMEDVTITNLPVLDSVKEMIQDMLPENWNVILCGNGDAIHNILQNFLPAQQRIKVLETLEEAMDSLPKPDKGKHL